MQKIKLISLTFILFCGILVADIGTCGFLGSNRALSKTRESLAAFSNVCLKDALYFTEKIMPFQKGQIPWNKNKTMSDDYCQNLCKLHGRGYTMPRKWTRRWQNLTNRKFGKLTALRIIGTNQNGNYIWECKCDCGNKKKLSSGTLLNGHTRSCGCLVKNRKRKLSKSEAGKNDVFSIYKRSAKKRNLSFALTREMFIALTSQNCFYCGAKPSSYRKAKLDIYSRYIYNGLDRINNNKGYDVDNVVPCCEACNRAKLKRTQKEFLKWAKRISRRHYQRKNTKKLMEKVWKINAKQLAKYIEQNLKGR